MTSGRFAEGRRLAELSRAVRGSTLKRLRAVPAGAESWRPARGAMSFADLADHLVVADRWLAEKLRSPELPPMTGEAGAAGEPDRETWLGLLAALEASGEERARLIASLDDAALAAPIHDARFGGEVTVWWVVVRGNLDHEAHHRGQIATYLRLVTAAG